MDQNLKRAIVDQYPQLHQPTAANGIELWTLLWKVLCTRFCTNEFVAHYENQFKAFRIKETADPATILDTYRTLWNKYEDAFKLTRSTFPEYTTLQPITAKYYIKKVMGALRAANIQYYNYIFEHMGVNQTVKRFEELVDECNNKFYFNPYAYVTPKYKQSNDHNNFINKQNKTRKQLNPKWNKNKQNGPKKKTTNKVLRCYKCTSQHYTNKCTLPKCTKCNRCGKPVHIARACKNEKLENKPKQEKQNNSSQHKENNNNNNNNNNRKQRKRWNDNKNNNNNRKPKKNNGNKNNKQ